MDLREIVLHKSQKRHPWELARIKVISYFIENLPVSSKKNLNILDVGSGDAFLIKELSKEFTSAHFFAIDIEYDQAYIDNTNQAFKEQNINIQVFNNQTTAENAIDGTVDLVLLLDVIEHVPDDIQFLQELSRSVRVDNQTLFLITVPSYQALFCSHDVFLGHYRRYTNKLLKQHINAANLTATDIGYFFTFPILPRIFQVLLEKRSAGNKNKAGISNWKGSELTSKILKNMLWIDFRISAFLRKFRITLPGLSNFAICKKSA